MSLGWGAMGAGAWGNSNPAAEPVPPGEDSDDTDALPVAAPPAAPSGSKPAKASPFPSAYPTSSIFSGGVAQNNAVFEGPAPPAAGRTHADLDAREKDLMVREANLKEMEEEIRKHGGFRKNNWPICFPIWHHDIQGEIPENARRCVREVYMCWWGFLFCLTWQFFCATVMLGYKPDEDAIPSWFLSIIYWIAGVAGSLWLWYKRLYHAARHGTSAGYIVFFLFFAIHICWCIWECIAFPVETSRWSFSGFATAIEAINVEIFPGIIYFMGGAFWVIETLWAIWCIKDVGMFFRGRGGIKQAKQDAALEAFRSQQARGSVMPGGAYNV